MKIYKVLLIAFACMFSTFALAVPTVAQVEASISKGEYTTAKKQLEEVLKKQPDSLVANKYMLEIIKLEYAKDQVPSVAYKLYEKQIVTIENNIAKEKERLAKIEEDRIKAEKHAKHEKQLRWFGIVLLLSVVGVALYFGSVLVYRHFQIKKRRLEEKRNIETWKSETRSALIDMNRFIRETQDASPDWYRRYPKLKYILDDTLTYLEDLKNDSYNGDDIDRHFNNAESYFKQVGLI